MKIKVRCCQCGKPRTMEVTPMEASELLKIDHLNEFVCGECIEQLAKEVEK